MMVRKWKIKIKLVFMLCALLILSFIFNFTEVANFKKVKKSFISKNQFLNSYIGTSKCRIPDLNINDGEIMKLLKPVRRYSCDKLPPLVISNSTSLYINVSASKKYGVKDIKKLKCWYIPFWRVNPKVNKTDHDVEYGKKKYFFLAVKIEDEFVKVGCKYERWTYKDFHAFVPLKKTSVKGKHVMNDEKLNVIIMGTDSLSRLHFHRTMPKTLKYLLEDLKAIEFMGYNKIGDNSYSNLIAALTGHSEEEVAGYCLRNNTYRFDNCSFVWQNYSRVGYTTSFGEEFSSKGIFNYKKNGWFNQPTDYYWNTFDYIALKELLKKQKRLYKTYPECLGARPMYKVLLHYAEKFIETLKNNNFFSFMWITSLAHDDDNTAVLAEEDYIKYLKCLKDSRTLNKSVLIFLSDHGPRFGNIRKTLQGYFEERLPYIFFVLPTWFEERYPVAVSNMRQNAYRLTTHYDLHATLNHILHPEELVDQKVSAVAPNERSVSLFRRISMERTCESAGIAMHWCTCREILPVNKNDSIVQKVANYTVRYLNNLLKNFTNCATLNLVAVSRSSLTLYNNHKNKTSHYYSVSLQTTPGGGLFDVIVHCNSCETNDFNISGSVSRLNRYGNSSYCIADSSLKLYCYCRQHLNNI